MKNPAMVVAIRGSVPNLIERNERWLVDMQAGLLSMED